MTEELTQHKMVVDQEEGEILEDGEIADDEDDIVAIGNHSPDQGTAIKDEKENKESNKSKFGSFSSYYPVDRDDHFKSNKRKKKNNSKKRKRSNSNESKRKLPGDLITNHNLVDVSPYINDPSYDSVELSDEDDYNFDLVPFDVLMEILGCTVGKELVENVLPFEKQRLMLRIVKIMKRQHGQDPDTSRRFARLKRRARERPNSNSNPGTKAVYKAICKFYLEGKCHKGSECYFSHDCVVPKRKELCKFYLQGFCGKGDDCLFMHGEFPCKFFHTNTECYSGDKCRFSHSALTEETREILRSYLDSGTLPDDPKPFRSHYSDWSNSNKNYNSNELNDHDSVDFDTSFNYETEQLLSRTRPVLLGEPTQKMKVSYETWNWQQELKDLEKAYTGLKKNLFCIDEIFAITEKPPTPRIEDDEEEVEAQIMNYYNDMLDTDEMDEMLALQEIEEHQKKVKEEVQIVKENGNDTPVFKENVLSEEEKRLIEASAHDEDLRVIPGLVSGPFASAPAISSVFDQVSFNPPSSYFPNSDNYSQANSFNDSSNTLPLDNKPEIPNYPEFGSPFSKQSNELTASDVSNMVRQIRNGTMAETTQGATASKPEYRDPRLNRLKDTNRMQSNNSQPSFVTAAEEKPISKPFFKVLNPNVIVEYKMASLKISIINYSSYFEYYQNDNALKNDPRLKKFFSSPMVDQKPNDSDYAFSKSNTEPEGLMPLPSLNIPQIKKATTIVSPPVPSKILSPLELISSKVKDNEASSSPTLSRDPRIRSKEVERRRNSDSKLDEQTKSPTAEEKLDHVNIATEDIPVIKHEATTSESPVTESATENSPDEASNLSSIPSYAMAALSSTRSLFSSVSNNLLFSNFNSTEKPANNQSPLITNENSYSGDSNTIDDDDDILENNALLVDEDDSLKVDLSQTETEAEPKCSKEESDATDTNTWPLNVTNNSIDSDNEMEIDLQHHESEVDSENENELIIASSSEPEDNKDCDSQNSDPVTISDYSVNC